MKKNVGSMDRNIRIILGLILISLFFFLEEPYKYISVLGLVSLASAFLNFCPLYKILGVNSCKLK